MFNRYMYIYIYIYIYLHFTYFRNYLLIINYSDTDLKCACQGHITY